jgi:protein-S-isoprenylcysteine O-methyltransferase Ste14
MAPENPSVQSSPSLGGRLAGFLYCASVYLLFLGTFNYVIGFIAGAVVPKHIDSPPTLPPAASILVNVGLLGLFALQHAVMARPWFKRMTARFVPKVAERATFVLATCLVLVLMVWQWRPIPDVVWSFEGAAAWLMHGLSALGWVVVLVSTCLIDHFELFGLRQGVLHLRGRAYEPPTFRERSLYRVVRHPIMVGFMLAFWSTPHMTAGHLLFAGLCTAYIFVGVALEERDLVAVHGDTYLNYRRRVRAFLPIPRRSAA